MNINKELQRYWKNPPKRDKGNLPDAYLDSELTVARTKLLVNYIKYYSLKNDSILEIGCNVGRNLNALYNNGFHNLYGIEISKNAIKELRNKYVMLKDCDIQNISVEDYLIKDNDKKDIIFTMAVLQHIPIESEWIFESISKKFNKYLITIEDEVWKSERHFPRNYGKVFEKYGLKQIYKKRLWFINSLGGNFRLRVFRRNE